MVVCILRCKFPIRSFQGMGGPSKTYPRPNNLLHTLPHSRQTRGPDAGPGGETVGRGRLSSGLELGMRICNNGAYEPEPAQKRIVTGGLWATLVISLGPMAARHSCIRDASGPGGGFCCPVFA